MNIVFYGGQTAGIISLLTILSFKKVNLKFIICEDERIENIAKKLSVPTINKTKINLQKTITLFEKHSITLLICCHGRKILKRELICSIPCVNLHPCLYKYKGANPIKRLIKDKEEKASVGAHFMTEKVDQGKVLIEIFRKVKLDSVAEVYNQIYDLYSQVVIEVINEFSNK